MESIIILVGFFVFFFPMVHVLVSNRSHGGAKLGWFLATFFFSWVAWLVFLICTQEQADKNRVPASTTGPR